MDQQPNNEERGRIAEMVYMLAEMREIYDDIDNPFRILSIIFRNVKDSSPIREDKGRENLYFNMNNIMMGDSCEGPSVKGFLEGKGGEISSDIKGSKENPFDPEARRLDGVGKELEEKGVDETFSSENHEVVMLDFIAAKLLSRLLGMECKEKLLLFSKLGMISYQRMRVLERAVESYPVTRSRIRVIDVILAGYVTHLLSNNSRDELLTSVYALG